MSHSQKETHRSLSDKSADEGTDKEGKTSQQPTASITKGTGNLRKHVYKPKTAMFGDENAPYLWQVSWPLEEVPCLLIRAKIASLARRRSCCLLLGKPAEIGRKNKIVDFVINTFCRRFFLFCESVVVKVQHFFIVHKF